MKQRKVVHVELNEPYQGKRHWYFGSSAAIYEKLPVEIVGISLRSLWNQGGRKYIGKKCTIRFGVLHTIPRKKEEE